MFCGAYWEIVESWANDCSGTHIHIVSLHCHAVACITERKNTKYRVITTTTKTTPQMKKKKKNQ